MSGSLISDNFLNEGIKDTVAWQALQENPVDFDRFKDSLSRKISGFENNHPNANESTTKSNLIAPTLAELGWENGLDEQGSGYGTPDRLLYLDRDARHRASLSKSKNEKWRYATVIQESKRFDVQLGTSLKSTSPHAQILNYLSVADSITDGKLRWGMLTNGNTWRLYDRNTIPRVDAFYEVDVLQALRDQNRPSLVNFYLLFRDDAYKHLEGDRLAFVETALEYGRTYEEKVTQELAKRIYSTVFPKIINLIHDNMDAPLSECRDNSLILLYRMLFLLFAEDKGLLPIQDTRYQEYSLRAIRQELGDKISPHLTLSNKFSKYFDQISNLFNLVNDGDDQLGVPPYNGGLFSRDKAPLLNEVKIPDSDFAPLLYELSFLEDISGGGRQYINYSQLSVQHLGSIYEQLLEKEPVLGSDQAIVIQHNPWVRKDSGSYYTPQELVDLVIEHTLNPLIEERQQLFKAKVESLKVQPGGLHRGLEQLREVDPACAALDLTILDPAMGSGHFLVSAVDALTDQIVSSIAYPNSLGNDWLDKHYESPLIEQIEATRREILDRARKRNWNIDATKLTDKTIISRMVLKRCIYGVDKNELAVELAKVSLWLHTFTVGTPLSFLDHHLRSGDSLVGLSWKSYFKEMDRITGGLGFGINVNKLERETSNLMGKIESMADSEVREVQESSKLFKQVEELNSSYQKQFDMLCGWAWLTAGLNKTEKTIYEQELREVTDRFTDPAFLAQDPHSNLNLPENFRKQWIAALEIAEQESFLHWELTFPGIWKNTGPGETDGGFDLVLGNPPWDRIRVEEVEWFALRDPEIANLQSKQRKHAIKNLAQAGGELILDFERAKTHSKQFSTYARGCGTYPLLSSGDINLYGLFVEKSLSLINKHGVVGLITPSGIFSDKPSARFFKVHSNNSRVGVIFDFENRRKGTGKGKFFPNIDGRMRFCVMVVAGAARKFSQTRCGFLLHSPEQTKDQERCVELTGEDFARLNPNTGTAPIFLNRSDADIVKNIYKNHPVLAHCNNLKSPYRFIHKHGLFHMSGDSEQFRTEEELTELGFYRVALNRWKRADEYYWPLYQARMISHFDHRANSVGKNLENLHNPYVSIDTSEEQHQDVCFLPTTQYFVAQSAVLSKASRSSGDALPYAIGFRNITNATNERTMISAIVPTVGFGNSLRLLLSPGQRDEDLQHFHKIAPLLVANFNAFVFDFIARSKLQGTNLSWFIVAQLPMITFENYMRKIGSNPAEDLVRDTVLKLTYTSIDMKKFAECQGFDGDPIGWNSEARRHLKARLDALYFHLYGVSRVDANYILEKFPIVRKHDLKEFGRYRTKELILGYMNALAAGDTETIISV